jgi:hypothetical protein
LKKVVIQHVPTYIKDSEELILTLRTTFPNGLPKGAKLFSADAVSMYSNINTDHGIKCIVEFLDLYKVLLPENFPKKMVVAALQEIMKNNIFQFGDTFWRQTSGTAMGTSTAVNYAVLYVALLEIKTLLTKYKNNLLFLKRFIDDTLGVWIPSDDNAWDDFRHDMNNYGTLKWTCDDGLVDTLIFLDITVTIDANRKLVFKTYQKPMNLYLYIPPTSAHSANLLKGLIFGRLRAYRLHNTNSDDYIYFATMLAKRLIARGWLKKTVLALIDEANNSLQSDAKKNIQQHETTTTKPIIFHLPYHPRGIQRQTIREVFNSTIGTHLQDRKLIVAVSRPRNLHERLSKTILSDVPGKNPSNYMNPGGDH